MNSAWTSIKGHQEQRALFERSVQRGRLSHAYVLAGPEGIGKAKFARLLAQSMFCRERQPDKIEACGECRACRSFVAGTWDARSANSGLSVFPRSGFDVKRVETAGASPATPSCNWHPAASSNVTAAQAARRPARTAISNLQQLFITPRPLEAERKSVQQAELYF